MYQWFHMDLLPFKLDGFVKSGRGAGSLGYDHFFAEYPYET